MRWTDLTAEDAGKAGESAGPAGQHAGQAVDNSPVAIRWVDLTSVAAGLPAENESELRCLAAQPCRGTGSQLQRNTAGLGACLEWLDRQAR